MPYRPGSRKCGEYKPNPNRFWSSRDGQRWRVWLDADRTRCAVAFVNMSWTKKMPPDEVRAVAVGTVLEALTDDELEGLLGGGT